MIKALYRTWGLWPYVRNYGNAVQDLADASKPLLTETAAKRRWRSGIKKVLDRILKPGKLKGNVGYE
jgi:hypothetical protein